MSRSDAINRNEVADDEAVACERGDTRNTENTRIRPARKAAGALTTATSVETAVDADGTIGVCLAGPRPKSVARSQVGNGAVKGARIRTTSQPATNRGSIEGLAPCSANVAPASCSRIHGFSDDFWNVEIFAMT